MMTVNLTAKGTAQLNKMLPGHFKRLTQLMACLSEPERKTLVRLLGKIISQVAIINGAPPKKEADEVEAG
jgi:DNA-binding MarR family transcriptional regulator